MANKNETANTNKGELAIIKSVNELPVLLPEMDKKELFNLVQESEPIAQLTDKKFKILGIMPEMVEVPANTLGEDESAAIDPFTNEPVLVERLRVTLITDIGVYHSFSITFNKALAKAINVFGAEYVDMTYTVSVKMRGSGAGAKAYYVVKVL